MREIKYTVLIAMAITVLVGCGKVDDTEAMKENALVIKKSENTDALIVPIGRVAVGGSQRNGTTHRCSFFKEEGGSPIVIIECVYEDYNYSMEPERKIEKIILNGLEEYLGLGNRIEIGMNQGRYEGSNAFINTVNIVSYRIGGYNDSRLQGNQCDIEIIMTTKKGDTISIHYVKDAVIIIGEV